MTFFNALFFSPWSGTIQDDPSLHLQSFVDLLNPHNLLSYIVEII